MLRLLTLGVEVHTLETYDVYRWVLPLPNLTKISMNDRLHPMKRAKLVKAWREAACEACEAAGVPELDRVRITLHHRPVDSRRRDAINLTPVAKAVEDGIVDAGVVPDDTPVYVTTRTPVLEPAQGRDNVAWWVVIERLLPEGLLTVALQTAMTEAARNGQPMTVTDIVEYVRERC